MHSVGIKVLKNRLSQYVRAAAVGETVLVTDRSQVVAELVSPRARADAPTTERRLGELVRLGLLTAAKGSSAAPLPQRTPVAKVADLMQELDRNRAER